MTFRSEAEMLELMGIIPRPTMALPPALDEALFERCILKLTAEGACCTSEKLNNTIKHYYNVKTHASTHPDMQRVGRVFTRYVHDGLIQPDGTTRYQISICVLLESLFEIQISYE